jgi:Zc3h12a-like Ribonuclease NYN domain
MTLFPFVLPLAQITFLTPPRRDTAPSEGIDIDSWLAEPMAPAILLGIVLVGLLVILLVRRPSARRVPATFRNPILVDGSNVMHWKDETPQVAPVQAVVQHLVSLGFTPGIMFDANAGYKLSGRYMNERDFATLLALSEHQIFVVPKGTQADPYLLNAARELGARVVTRDRFRDWAEAHPEVKEPGFLIRGGYRSNGEFWLDEALPLAAAAQA